MHLEPTSTIGQQWIADHAPDFEGDVDWLLNDGTFRCGECDEPFTDASDLGYGENRDRICRECCIEANHDRRFGWAR